MKLKYLATLLTIVLLVGILAACGGDETPTPEPQPTATIVPESPTEPPPTEAPPTEVPPTEVPPTPASPLASMEHTPDPLLVDKTWEWERRDSSEGSTEITVPNPDAYTLLFNEDGTFNATLDCNSAAGAYATDQSGSIFMELGPSTMAACGPDSLADQMANMFGPAQDYRFEEDGQVLVFSWVAGGPLDYFRDAAAEKPGEAEVEAIPPGAIQMDLQGLADSYEWSVQPGFPPSPGPGGGGMPPHILMTFDGATPEEALTNNGPVMYIFPTQAYIGMYNAQGNSIVQDQVTRLEQLIAEADGRQSLPDSPMPLLPPPNSFMDRWAQFGDLDFGVGRGLRYVSDSPNRQQIGLWTNDTTGYYYEGLTGNGVFYVSLFWPVSTESLPNTTEDVPEDVSAAAADPETYPTYLQETKDTLNPLPSSAWLPNLDSLDAMMASLTFPTGAESEAEDGLTGTTWLWLSLTTPGELLLVDDPTSYTIVFNDDGTAAIRADCNNVTASYTVDGSSITITLGPSTLAACSEGSLDQNYLTSLENAAIYFLEEGDLYMDLTADAGTMRFSPSETVELPPPDDGEPTGTITAPDGVYVRSGPGTDYPDIGAVPFGATGEIIGRSADGQWWVINVPPTAQAPDGQGWVSAAFVEASNAGNVPVIPAPPLEANLAGTAWQWLSLTKPAGLTAVNDPSRYTIAFNADGTANIKADCNNVGATYTLEGSNINISLGPTTLAACPEDSLDQQFLADLENARIYFFEGGDLFMDLMADAGTMRFTAGSLAASPGPAAPSDTDSISGGADDILLQLVSYGPAGAEQPVLEGTQITATFSDAEVAGSAGCNNYTGALTAVNDYFTVGPIVTTQQACSDPAGIMEQEQAYLTALEGTTGYRWQSQPLNGTTVITAGQLFYTLSDGTEGVLNFIAPG
jgi:heat shock protein HslJ